MNSSLRLLLVDDSEDDATLLLRTLRQGGYEPDCQRVDTPAAMTAALSSRTWDVVISDYRMPNFSGPEALRLLQESGLDLPFIIMSGVMGEQAAVEAMKAGAHDYILKGDSARLVPAIQRELRDSAMRQQNRQLEAQLLHAQKLENIGRLAGGIAHDFNNLLTPILGYSQLAVTCAGSSEPIAGYLREVESAAQRGANLTRQLLAFSRRQLIEPKIICLNQLISDMDKMLRRLIGEDIELITLPASNLGPTKVDPGQMEQLLVNLVVNARDAMPRGGRITVHTGEADLGEPRRTYVTLSVSDTGTGMTEEVKAHLFEPFFTTKEPGKGTGLGLATCYGIVQQNGGHMEVNSELGRGTVFRVFIPRAEEAIASPAAAGESSPMPQGTETVLLAEDDPAVRGLAARILRERGYTVMDAADGREALSLAQKHATAPIHLLLTDLVMPQMGGQELAGLLRDLRPGIKVLFTSAHPEMASALLDAPGGNLHLLLKPFEPASLSRKVRAALDR